MINSYGVSKDLYEILVCFNTIRRGTRPNWMVKTNMFFFLDLSTRMLTQNTIMYYYYYYYYTDLCISINLRLVSISIFHK